MCTTKLVLVTTQSFDDYSTCGAVTKCFSGYVTLDEFHKLSADVIEVRGGRGMTDEELADLPCESNLIAEHMDESDRERFAECFRKDYMYI